MAEALALRAAMLSCRRMEMKKIRFESDSSQLIKIINSGLGVAELHGVVADLLSLCNAFEFVSFMWIPRERNTFSDSLAKSALNASSPLVVGGGINGPD
ncbi:hypothetical protein Bca4012_063473 [Brassica carinata]